MYNGLLQNSRLLTLEGGIIICIFCIYKGPLGIKDIFLRPDLLEANELSYER